MSSKHGATGTATLILAIIVVVLAATTTALNGQGQSISSLQSTVSSLVSHPVTVTATQLSTTTSVRTQTVLVQTNYTVTETTTDTQTSTTTEIMGTTTYVQFYGLYYLSDLPGCAVSSGYASDPTPCFGQVSTAVTFNCEAAAATSEGCNHQVDIMGSDQSMNITVWFPYVNYSGEGPSQNCKWTEYLPAPLGPQTALAYCIPVNSTSFYVTLPAPPLAAV
jgi:hypothetical protein